MAINMPRNLAIRSITLASEAIEVRYDYADMNGELIEELVSEDGNLLKIPFSIHDKPTNGEQRELKKAVVQLKDIVTSICHLKDPN